MSARMRVWWFAAIAFVAMFGIGDLVIWIGQSPSWWAQDLVTYDAARRLTDGGALYADPKFLYPPLASLLGIPFLVLDRVAASLALAAGKILLAVLSVLWLTSGWRVSNRALAIVAVVTSLPFLHDLMLGNTNVLAVAAMVPAVFGRSHPRNGILMGLAGAALAKPLMIPVLLWLLVWRRGTFVGAVIAGAIGSAVGVVAFGLSSYGDWIASVRSASIWLSTPFEGNHGVTAIDPAFWPPVAAVTAVLFVLVLARRGPRTGLVWALTSAILLVSYAGTYSALPIALALPVIAPLAPMLAFVVVAISPIATTIPLPFFAGGILLASLALREPRAACERVGLQPASAHG
jgi:hypothetical protein